jgi:hypothetical protein
VRVEQREQNRNGNPLTFILSPFRKGRGELTALIFKTANYF